MTQWFSRLLLSAGILLLAAAGAKAAPGDGSAFDWHLPPGFHAPAVPPDNPMSEAKVQLGRRLFYDQRMSINGKGRNSDSPTGRIRMSPLG
jgi:cytochrome c peroxidase